MGDDLLFLLLLLLFLLLHGHARSGSLSCQSVPVWFVVVVVVVCFFFPAAGAAVHSAVAGVRLDQRLPRRLRRIHVRYIRLKPLQYLTQSINQSITAAAAAAAAAAAVSIHFLFTKIF